MRKRAIVSAKSRAETVFEEYLSRHGINWEYEALPGVKKPDYLIPYALGKCIIEVKQIEDPNPLRDAGFSPDLPVRKKISAARKQLREYKDFRCTLAVFSESIFGPTSPLS